MNENTAINEYTKSLRAKTGSNTPLPTFIDWLSQNAVAIADLPAHAQFWLYKSAKKN